LDYTGSFSEDVYRDRSKGWRRTFTLSGDRLIIESKQFLGTESESAVLLRDINPMYSIVRMRNPMAGGGVLVVAIMVMISVFLPYVGTPTGPPPNVLRTLTHGPMGIFFGVSVLYAIWNLKNVRRIELYEFASRSLRFSIARNGPDKKRFDAFVERLLARVQEAQHPVIVSKPATSDEGRDRNFPAANWADRNVYPTIPSPQPSNAPPPSPPPPSQQPTG
jgi:hypothetical protein